jgi:regulatory protein
VLHRNPMLRRTRAGKPTAEASAGPPTTSLKSIAIRLLARREFGRVELAQRLRARGGESDAIERTLDELTALGYLSDARFAQALVAQRAGRYSARAIARELKERRIGDDTAHDALQTLAGHDELAQATALWQRRFGAPPRDAREKARQVRFLLSRGYSTELALKVLRAAATSSDRE